MGFAIEPLLLAAQQRDMPLTRLAPIDAAFVADMESAFITAGWWVLDEFAQEYPDTTRLLQRAFAETNEYIYGDEEKFSQFLDVAEQATGIGRELLRAKFDQNLGGPPLYFDEWPNGANPVASFGAYQDAEIKYLEEIGEDGRVDPAEFVLPWDVEKLDG